MIKTSGLVLAVLLVTSISISGGGQEPANDISGTFVSPYQERVSISGIEFSLIESAVAEFRMENLNIRTYNIVLCMTDDGYWVSFEDPERPQNIGESSPRMSEFEVELDNVGNVLDSHYVR